MIAMNTENQWMMMTYYCPTHGSRDRCEQILVTKEELNKVGELDVTKKNKK